MYDKRIVVLFEGFLAGDKQRRVTRPELRYGTFHGLLGADLNAFYMELNAIEVSGEVLWAINISVQKHGVFRESR